jgi:hypothetical protein
MTFRDLRIRAMLIAIAFVGIFRPGEVRSQKFVYSTPPDSLHPRVQYADGSISLNDRCAVRMIKLSRSMRPIYVNGQPIGFC